MLSFLKFLFFFLVAGIVWFFVFSIPLNKTTNLFLVFQKQLNMHQNEEDADQTNKKAIDRERVIDALTKAFEDK